MVTPDEIREVEFIRNLGTEHLHLVARMAQLKEYDEGTVIFHQGQGSPFIYFILTGKVCIQADEPGGSSMEVSRLGGGELLGWSPVLGRHAMTATARALTPCRLAMLDVHQILNLCERDPQFGYELMCRTAMALAKRLSATRMQLLDVYGGNLPVVPFEVEAR